MRRNKGSSRRRRRKQNHLSRTKLALAFGVCRWIGCWDRYRNEGFSSEALTDVLKITLTNKIFHPTLAFLLTLPNWFKVGGRLDESVADKKLIPCLPDMKLKKSVI
jgi:hypothetical protein